MRVLLVALLLVSAAAQTHNTFEVAGIRNYGCNIQHSSSRWYVRAWAERDGDDCHGFIKSVSDDERQRFSCIYLRLLSVRDSQDPAMKDCSRWMEDVQKKLAEVQKLQAKQGS